MVGIDDRRELAQRVAKLFVFGMRGIKPERDPDLMDLLGLGPGGVFLFSQNMESQAQARHLIEELRDLSPHKQMLVAVDQEGGRVCNVPGLKSPAPADQRTVPEAHAWAVKNAVALRQLGFDLNLAPLCDVGYGKGIGNRSFGLGAHEVAVKANAAVHGYRKANVMSCAKHFPGYGDSEIDAHWGTPHLKRLNFSPFLAAFKAGVPFTMMGHVIVDVPGWPDVPASLSHHAHYFLRHELGFNGAIVTDDVSMHGVKSWNGIGVGEAAVRAIVAGTDLVIATWPEERKEAFKAVFEAVRGGRIAQDRLLEATMNVAMLPHYERVKA